MVIQKKILLLVFLISGCSSPKNLYGEIIEPEIDSKTKTNEIRLDGYYYCLFSYRGQDETYIMTLLFYENGHVVETDLKPYKNLENFENKLLSSEFKKYFKNNENRLFPVYEIKDASLLTQSIQGGGTYANHVQTKFYKIIDLEKIQLVKIFGLKIIDQDKIFIFKRFDKKPNLNYWTDL